MALIPGGLSKGINRLQAMQGLHAPAELPSFALDAFL
jgi:hypothetical protein